MAEFNFFHFYYSAQICILEVLRMSPKLPLETHHCFCLPLSSKYPEPSRLAKCVSVLNISKEKYYRMCTSPRIS